MQTVIAGIIEINKLFFNHRIHTCHCIKVYDRYSPYISRLLNSLHIGIYIFSATILIAFIRLDILIAEVSQRTVQRSQQNDLLIREKCLQLSDSYINTPSVSVLSHDKRTLFPRHHLLHFTVSRQHLLFLFRKPLTDRHTTIIIVCPHKNQDSIDFSAMFFLQLFRLTGYIIPLPSTNAVNKRSDPQPFFQKVPVLLYIITVAIRVCDGISDVSYFLALPGMLNTTLFIFRKVFCYRCLLLSIRQTRGEKQNCANDQKPVFHCFILLK